MNNRPVINNNYSTPFLPCRHNSECFCPAWLIGTGPMLCQHCVIHCISGRFNSQWQELDKWIVAVMTFRKSYKISLEC